MKVLVGSAICWICVMVVASAALAASPATPVPTAAGPVRVRVGSYLLNVGSLDTETGTYTMDLYLSLNCDRACDPSAFEIMNGRAIEKVAVDDKALRKVFRVEASLSTPMDLRNYPFDTHRLGIVIEDGKIEAAGEVGQTIEDQIYVVEPAKTGLAPTVRVAGWEIDPRWQARTYEFLYAPFGETYSRYEFAIRIRRPVLSALLKVVLPAIFLFTVGLLSLFLLPEKVTERLALATSALVVSVLLHLNVTSTLPPVGYLTFADKFMLGNYAALVLIILAAVVMTRLSERVEDARMLRVRTVSLIAIPAVWVVLQALNVLTL